MRKFRLTIFIVLLAAMLLAACQSGAKDPTAATTDPNVQPTWQTFKGDATECTIQASLIPEVPVEQIPPVPLASAEDWLIGDVDAPVSIIEYSDFQCPYCSTAAPELERFQADFADQVNFVFRHFPLTSIHDRAMPASKAAEAAGAQGKFFEMHDLLFANQAVWGAAGYTIEQFDTWVTDQAKTLGLNTAQFTKDYTSKEIETKLNLAYTEATETIGLSGTPSVFIVINGVPYMAPSDYATLAGIMKLIDLDQHRFTECPPMIINTAKSYTATITTTKGDVVVDLYDDQAPLTVNSFVFLSKQGFYNNVDFHRVIPGFVAQAGDPSGSGLGGPGYEFANEISDLKFDGEGVLGMANAGADTNGSQFFITYAAQTNLDGGYTVFGKVIEGMEIVNLFNAIDPQQGTAAGEPDKIVSIKITEK
jgi:cyclophilin family peptidyl-prolyl cis-trans isomerase/protein-disulfide isomerase